MPNQYTNPWTLEQKNSLQSHSSTYSVRTLSKKVGHSEGETRRMLQTIRKNEWSKQGYMTPNQLSKHLGICSKTVTKWIEKHALHHIEDRADFRTSRKNNRYYVHPRRFWRWAKHNKNLVNFNKIKEPHLFPFIPEWAILETRKQSTITISKVPNDPFEEEENILNLYKSGSTMSEISKHLGCGVREVEKRIKKVRLQGEIIVDYKLIEDIVYVKGFKRSNLKTVKSLSKALSVSESTVKKLYHDERLPMHLKRIRLSSGKVADMFIISEQAFWSWYNNNPSKINGAKLKRSYFSFVPEWFEIHIARNYKKQFKPYTESEDRKLIAYKKQGYTFKAIGEMLARSENSAANRYRRICKYE